MGNNNYAPIFSNNLFSPICSPLESSFLYKYPLHTGGDICIKKYHSYNFNKCFFSIFLVTLLLKFNIEKEVLYDRNFIVQDLPLSFISYCSL